MAKCYFLWCRGFLSSCGTHDFGNFLIVAAILVLETVVLLSQVFFHLISLLFLVALHFQLFLTSNVLTFSFNMGVCIEGEKLK